MRVHVYVEFVRVACNDQLFVCQPVNVGNIIVRQSLELTDSDCLAKRTLSRHLFNLLIGSLATDKFGDADGHADLMIEAADGADALHDRLPRMFEVVGHSHDVDSKLCKACGILDRRGLGTTPPNSA